MGGWYDEENVLKNNCRASVLRKNTTKKLKTLLNKIATKRSIVGSWQHHTCTESCHTAALGFLWEFS